MTQDDAQEGLSESGLTDAAIISNLHVVIAYLEGASVHLTAIEADDAVEIIADLLSDLEEAVEMLTDEAE